MLTQYRPRKFWWRRWTQRAAVAAVLATHTAVPSILLMERATRPGDPWAGQMSFPGGRTAPTDAHVYHTALRETAEELGLDLATHGQYLGRLSDRMARPRRGMRLPLIVTPFVFQVTAEPHWQLAPREVASIVWVPLPFLADPANRQSMVWQRGHISRTLPCYWYNGYRIWGLTLSMLDELVPLLGDRV